MAVIGIEQRHVRDWLSAAKCFLRGGKIATDLGYFFIKRNRRAIGTDERAVIFLLSVERAAPLPVANFVRAMRDCLPRHGSNFPFIKKVVHARPIHCTWLSLHDPKIFPFESAGQVVG